MISILQDSIGGVWKFFGSQLHFLRSTKVVACSRAEKRRYNDRTKVLVSKFRRLPDWMERIREQRESIDRNTFCDNLGSDPASH